MTKAQQTANSANLSASYLAAAFFGAFFAWPMMEIYGRRITCRIAAVYFTIGAILMTAAQGQLSMICKAILLGTEGTLTDTRCW